MSKGNLFLGYARGSVGDLVFSRLDGEQITRARNRAPRNPQTALQLLQRVILKTSSIAFSFMQDICNHAFEGRDGVTMNQARFNKLNIDELRIKCADVINSGSAGAIYGSTLYNFNGKNDTVPIINPYILSEGSLPSLNYSFAGSADEVLTLTANRTWQSASALTYQDVCDVFDLQRGDQLTFITIGVNDTIPTPFFGTMAYARIILDPASGDMTTAFLSGTSVNSPNPRNSGVVKFTPSASSASDPFTLQWHDMGADPHHSGLNSLLAGAVIVSRQQGGRWLRSSQSLIVRPWVTGDGALIMDHGTALLGDAVLSYVDGVNSSLYLNQAGF